MAPIADSSGAWLLGAQELHKLSGGNKVSPADLDDRDLAVLRRPVHRRATDAQQLRCFVDRHRWSRIGSGTVGDVVSVVVSVVVMHLEGEREALDATNEFTDFSLPAGAKR